MDKTLSSLSSVIRTNPRQADSIRFHFKAVKLLVPVNVWLASLTILDQKTVKSWILRYYNGCVMKESNKKKYGVTFAEQ